MTEDEKFEQVLESENPLMKAAVGIVRGAHLIEPFEPEMANETRKRFHEFSARQRVLLKRRDRKQYARGLADMRDSLLVIAAIVSEHKIDEARLTNGQLVDGFLNLACELEEWAAPFGLKPRETRIN